MKPKKSLLTSRQAWKLLEVMFESRFGICHAILQLENAGVISLRVGAQLTRQVRKEARKQGKTTNEHLWPLDAAACDGPRAAFCRAQWQRRK